LRKVDDDNAGLSQWGEGYLLAGFFLGVRGDGDYDEKGKEGTDVDGIDQEDVSTTHCSL
jgi:hypothetical protein